MDTGGKSVWRGSSRSEGPGAGRAGGLTGVREGHERRAPDGQGHLRDCSSLCHVPSRPGLACLGTAWGTEPCGGNAVSHKQAELRETMGQFQTSGINIAIKQVTRSFGFPIHKSHVFIIL